MRKKFLLVDGTNVVMRYAFAMLGDRQASPSNDDIAHVLGGVGKALHACAHDVRATHLVVALDSPVSSWRSQLYPQYKTNRATSTSQWSHQFFAWCERAGVQSQHWSANEADDVIATLATRIVSRYPVAVLSADSDLLVLAAIGAECYQFGGKGEARFAARPAAWIAEKYGIKAPALLADFKALVGEPGDNIPGLPGVGPVRARKLLGDYGSIASMLAGKVLDPQPISTYLQLVSLRRDLPLPSLRPSECALRQTVAA